MIFLNENLFGNLFQNIGCLFQFIYIFWYYNFKSKCNQFHIVIIYFHHEIPLIIYWVLKYKKMQKKTEIIKVALINI